YQSRDTTSCPPGDVLVLTADAKGIVMRREALREHRLQRLNRQDYGGSRSRVRPVWARNAVSRSGRYWMRLSRLRTIAARWFTTVAARLPRLRLTCGHTPSVGLRSGA